MDNLKLASTNTKDLGFYKLSHTIFEIPQIKNLTGEHFRLYVWMLMKAWRFPDSTGTIRASLSYIQRHLPISESTATRALKSLQKLGVIKMIEKNFREGNLWLILPPDQTTKIRETPKAAEAKYPPKPDLKIPPKKKPLNQEGEILSRQKKVLIAKLEKTSKILADYFKQLHGMYWKAEEKSYELLKSKWDIHKIEHNLIALIEKGTISGAICNCPLSYLAKLISIQQDEVPSSSPNTYSNGLNAVNPSQLRPAFEDLEVELQKAFPTKQEQDAYLKKVEPIFPFAPPGSNILKFLALGKWLNEQKQNTNLKN